MSIVIRLWVLKFFFGFHIDRPAEVVEEVEQPQGDVFAHTEKAAQFDFERPYHVGFLREELEWRS